MASQETFVKPSLPSDQLDLFTDARAPEHQLRLLSDRDQRIIITAWRCAYYLGVFFHWNTHLTYYNTSLGRGISLSMSKNLILELMYAVAYRVQELITMLLYLINETLYPQHRTSDSPDNHLENYDPSTVLFALRIVYNSVKKFKGGEFKNATEEISGGILEIKSFLNDLHIRAPAAITTINKYRHQNLGVLCRESSSLKTLGSLIHDSAATRSIVSFTFERVFPDRVLFWDGPSETFKAKLHNEMLMCDADKAMGIMEGWASNWPVDDDDSWKSPYPKSLHFDGDGYHDDLRRMRRKRKLSPSTRTIDGSQPTLTTETTAISSGSDYSAKNTGQIGLVFARGQKRGQA